MILTFTGVGAENAVADTKRRQPKRKTPATRLLGVAVAVGTVWLIGSAVFEIFTVDPSERESTFGYFLAIPLGIIGAFLLLGSTAGKPPD